MIDLTEREYVPTLAERMAEAIPTALTATPHVGVGGARRLEIAHAILPIVEAELTRLKVELHDVKHDRDHCAHERDQAELVAEELRKRLRLAEAAARADERAKVAAEIQAARRTGITAMFDHGWNHAIETAAAIARQHAGNGSSVAVEPRTPTPESDRTSNTAETPSGRATGGVYTGPPIPLGRYGCVLNPFETPDTRDDRQEQ